jgi:multidrug resistance efflux pump
MAEQKEIELKTEDVNELLTSVPKWIIRWGVTMIFSIMVAALALSYFIKYPDTLAAKATITTLNPPTTLISKANGKIIELKVKNSQSVKKDDVLLVIESAANYNSILAIDTILKDFDKNDSLNYIKLNRLSLLGKHGEGLGGITPMFIVFFKSYNDYKLQKELNPQIKEVEIIDKELAEYQALQGKFQNQENIYKEEFSLIEKDFNRFTTLFSNQSISAKEFEDNKREFLSAKRNYESIKITNINNKLAINNLEKNKLQLQIQAYQEIERFEKALSQSVQTLQSEIETWEQTYLLKAPIEGKVSLFNYWAINQNIKQGDEILSIVPSIKQEIIAKLFLPVQNSNKLKIGQTVNIKLDNYQFQEFGMLKGRVENVSLVPQKDTYAIEVSLPNNLITSYNKQLVYKEEMQGTADIITEELSVFDRVFYQFRKILK